MNSPSRYPIYVRGKENLPGKKNIWEGTMTRSRRCCLKGILTSTMLPLSTFSLTYVWIPASGSPPEKTISGHWTHWKNMLRWRPSVI